jgi:mRNA-degrading endonuclease toxin of MazEF toxin-antitoxin module
MSVNVYSQGDIILIRYPLSDKPEKSIIRPVVVISNEASNSLDKDILVCQITTRLRGDRYSYLISTGDLKVPMPEVCEVRCNKIATVRIWDKIVLDKISEFKPESFAKLLMIIKTVF